nr:PREDICTED: formin-binding protein 1-like isoform X3 [Latimeria chalumnae]|eukprot:XP_006013669.1 PREDICTED: formin-binding protein 1-like isoform X3 [Latimeria chalumnae]
MKRALATLLHYLLSKTDILNCIGILQSKQQLNLRTHMADESKNEYAAQLQSFNGEQHKHFYAVIPQIFKNLQVMDERRTVKLSECYKGFADAEHRVIPIISKCLEGMINAAKSVDEHRGPAPEDFSHLPPEQRRKKLQHRIDELNKELQKEMDQRDGLSKMKDVYEKSPQMGDPGSLQPKISETNSNIERLRMEIQKNEAWLSEVEGKGGVRGERRLSTEVNHLSTHGRESPEGSYTEDANQEHRSHQQLQDHHNEFDDEFEDDDPLPAIGHCKAMYQFDGQNEGTLAMKEGEILYVIEEDKGDGWTRARRQSGEEGYVPTSYIDITLEKNSKGAVTYI